MSNLIKIISLLSFSILFISCKPKQAIVEENDEYEVVYKSLIAGKKERSNVIIKNYEDFNTLISDLNIGEEAYEKLLNIDLEKHDLLVSFLGEKTTGGYNIEVEKVKFLPTSTEVSLKEIVPEKTTLVTSVISHSLKTNQQIDC